MQHPIRPLQGRILILANADGMTNLSPVSTQPKERVTVMSMVTATLNNGKKIELDETYDGRLIQPPDNNLGDIAMDVADPNSNTLDEEIAEHLEIVLWHLGRLRTMDETDTKERLTIGMIHILALMHRPEDETGANELVDSIAALIPVLIPKSV